MVPQMGRDPQFADHYLMKKHLRPRCSPFERSEGTMPRHASILWRPCLHSLPGWNTLSAKQRSSQLQKYKAANLKTTQKLRMRIKCARNFLFFIVWLLYVQLLRGKNRYGLVWAVMINPPELPINDYARNDANITSTGVKLY